MSKTTVLFVCPDNSLLSPLAEAYLNFRAGGLMRAFSAGVAPSQELSRHVRRILSARGIDAKGLAPLVQPFYPRSTEQGKGLSAPGDNHE